MKKHLTLFISAIILLSSCTLKPLGFGGVQDGKVNSMNQKGIDAEFGLQIKNPNNWGFKIYNSDIKVTVNGLDVGEAKLKKNVRIKRKSESVSTFQVTSDFSKLGLTDLSKLMSLAGSKSANVSVKGQLKVGKWYYKKSFPVDLTQKIPLSK